MTIDEARENCERIVNNAESMLEGRESIATLLTDHARLVERNRILEDEHDAFASHHNERCTCSAIY